MEPKPRLQPTQYQRLQPVYFSPNHELHQCSPHMWTGTEDPPVELDPYDAIRSWEYIPVVEFVNGRPFEELVAGKVFNINGPGLYVKCDDMEEKFS